MGTLSRQRLGVQVFRRELHTHIYIKREREREFLFECGCNLFSLIGEASAI